MALKKSTITKMLFPLAMGAVIIILWQILVLNLLERAVIGSFAALVLLCLFYAILGVVAAVSIKNLIKRIGLIAKPDELNAVDRKEREKLQRLEKRDDELGKLISSATQAIRSFSEVINGIKAATDELEVVTGEFNELFINMSSAIYETDRSTEIIVKNTTGQENEIINMQQRVGEISGLIGAISQQMQGLDQAAKNMLEHDRNVVNSVGELTVLSTQGSAMIQDVKQQMIQTNATIQQIGRVTELISGIAKHTKILALNASIEAARAGEYGKGFSVVAGQIKQLAEQSQGAVEQINDTIVMIQSNSNKNMQSVEFVFEAFEKQSVKIVETEQTLRLLNEEFAKMEEVAAKVDGIIAELIINKEQINRAGISLRESSAENAKSVDNAVQSMKLLKKISTDCETGKNRIVGVSNGLIGYISRFREHLKKRP